MIDKNYWPEIKIPNYQFTACINIKTAPNGSRLDVMVGYVTKHPEKQSIVLSSSWPKTNGFFDNRIFYIHRKDDWKGICEAINSVWPEVEGKVTEDEIKEAVKKVAMEKKLIDVLVANPSLIDSFLDDTGDLMSLTPEQREASFKLMKAGGDIATKTAERLSREPITDLTAFNEILDEYRLVTVNSLVTHIKGRINFIDTFEKAIYNEQTYERRGDDSIHNLLKQNIWLVNRNYQVLQDDSTLKNIIYQNWNKPFIGEAAGNRPDFLCMTELNPSDFLVIIEIKRPSVVITLDMLEQIIEYKMILAANSERKYDDFKCLLMGRELHPLVKAAELYKAGYVAKTYADFIGEARRFYHEYLEIVENSPRAL